MIDANHRAVRGDAHHIHTIDFAELFLFGFGGSRHTRQFLIESEVVLEGHDSDGLALLLDGHALFGFQCLVDAVAEAAPVHQAPRELVHDNDFAVAHHIVDIFFEVAVRLESGVDVGHQLHLFGEVVHAHHLLQTLDAFFGESHGVVFLIHHIVASGLQPTHIRVDSLIDGEVFLNLP